MIRIQEYERGFASSNLTARPASVDAAERRQEAYRMFGEHRYQIVVDLVENSLEALLNLGATAAARDELQILADLGCEVERWESRIAAAERKEAA